MIKEKFKLHVNSFYFNFFSIVTNLFYARIIENLKKKNPVSQHEVNYLFELRRRSKYETLIIVLCKDALKLRYAVGILTTPIVYGMVVHVYTLPSDF